MSIPETGGGRGGGRSRMGCCESRNVGSKASPSARSGSTGIVAPRDPKSKDVSPPRSTLRFVEDHHESASVSWRSDLSKTDICYATFGSNMWEPRFRCYIEGGQVDGMQKPCSGSMDKSLREEILWKTFRHRLFFGKKFTSTWGPGGVAFLHPESKNEDIVHMRLYRITLEQFNDVLLQENGSSYDMSSPLFDLASLDRIKVKGSSNLEALKKDIPILTMKHINYLCPPLLEVMHDLETICQTNFLVHRINSTFRLADPFRCDKLVIENFRSGEVPLRAPSEDYANMLVRGLVEGGQLSEEEAVSYIKEAAAKPL